LKFFYNNIGLTICMSYTSYSVNTYSTRDVFGYRGFTQADVFLLAASGGQGETCSKTGATGLFAAIDWIDDFYVLGNTKNGRVYPPEEFNWYGWDRFYSDLCDRSKPGKKPEPIKVVAEQTKGVTDDPK
jgi:hypothetical protein